MKYLANLIELEEFRDGLTHNGHFAGAVVNLFHINRGPAGLDDELVVADGDEQAVLREDRPIFDDQGLDQFLGGSREMIEWQLFIQPFAILGLVKREVERRIDDVERRRWVDALPKDVASVHRTENGVEVVRLIGKSAIVDKNVLRALGTTLRLRCNADGLARRRASGCGGRRGGLKRA